MLLNKACFISKTEKLRWQLIVGFPDRVFITLFINITEKSNITYDAVMCFTKWWISLHPCMWVTEPFSDAPFIARRDTITCHQWTCSPMECSTQVFWSILQLYLTFVASVPTCLKHIKDITSWTKHRWFANDFILFLFFFQFPALDRVWAFW